MPLSRDKRIDAAGLDLTKLPCWFPLPTKSESLDIQPGLVELSDSSGDTFLENVLICLRKQGYSEQEVWIAITEHIETRRVTLDTTGEYPIVHATDRLRCWADSKSEQSQASSSPSKKLRKTLEGSRGSSLEKRKGE